MATYPPPPDPVERPVAQLKIHLKTALTGKGMKIRMKRMAVLVQERVIDRIEKGGDDEITFARLDFKRTSGDSENPLYSTGSHLMSSITHGIGGRGFWVGSTMKGSPVLQHGTVGKTSPGVGRGTMPTIRPKTAKALFIPLTPRAAKSVITLSQIGKKVRKGLGRKKGKKVETDLKQGKDFVFVSKADIRPRPFLRLSVKDMKELAKIMATGDSK